MGDQAVPGLGSWRISGDLVNRGPIPTRSPPSSPLPDHGGHGLRVWGGGRADRQRDAIARKSSFHPRADACRGTILADLELTVACPASFTAAPAWTAAGPCLEAYCTPALHPETRRIRRLKALAAGLGEPAAAFRGCPHLERGRRIECSARRDGARGLSGGAGRASTRSHLGGRVLQNTHAGATTNASSCDGSGFQTAAFIRNTHRAGRRPNLGIDGGFGNGFTPMSCARVKTLQSRPGLSGAGGGAARSRTDRDGRCLDPSFAPELVGQ